MAKRLILLAHTPRRLDGEEYARFIREVDSPAFRQHPHTGRAGRVTTLT